MNKKAFAVAILSIIIGGSGTFIYIDNSTNIFNNNETNLNVDVDLEMLRELCAGDVPDVYKPSCKLLVHFP